VLELTKGKKYNFWMFATDSTGEVSEGLKVGPVPYLLMWQTAGRWRKARMGEHCSWGRTRRGVTAAPRCRTARNVR